MITTVTLWLLMSVGKYERFNTTVVERFSTAAECERVRKLVDETTSYTPAMRCIQATIAITKDSK